MRATKLSILLLPLIRCQVDGCNNPAEEAHHCLFGKRKGICELNLYENLQLVCRLDHHITGKAKTWENRVLFWKWACSWYGERHMLEWLDSVPLKIKPRYKDIVVNGDE